MAGRLITFEGIEGSGKSTQATRLVDHLRREFGLKVVRAHEPGEGLGEDLRDRMLQRADFQPWTMACLMSADRCEHVAHTIRPQLDRGAWVVCDRYTDSTIAYQGGGLGLPIEALRLLNAQATGGLTPHRTIVCDLDVDRALARVRARVAHAKLDRFESAERAFHERVRATYLRIRDEEPDRVVIVNADLHPDAVFAQVREAVMPLIDMRV